MTLVYKKIFGAARRQAKDNRDPVWVMTKDGHHRELNGSEPRLSRASVGRLSLYLRRLEGLLREGIAKVSSGHLGEALCVSDAQVRKDLAYLGNLGHPGIGYPTHELLAAIRAVLGI